MGVNRALATGSLSSEIVNTLASEWQDVWVGILL